MKQSAGLAIINNDKVLLVHPTGNTWEGRQSIPKGALEEGETALEAAIRETEEEIGINVDKLDIDPVQYVCEYRNKKNKKYKVVYYYIYLIKQIPNKYRYQIEEVDYADFYSFDEAKKLILPKQLTILFNLKEMGLIK